MRQSSKECKRMARELLNGNYKVPMQAYLIAAMLPLAVELPFSMLQKSVQPLYMTIAFYAAELLIVLLNVVLQAGVQQLHLLLARRKPYDWKVVFYGFRNRPDRFIIAGVLLVLAGAASCVPVGAGGLLYYFYGKVWWTILLLILLGAATVFLGIYAALSYALTLYLLLDHEELSAVRAMKLSRCSMKGKRLRLCYLLLSFLGMQALCLLSFGIGSLWVTPYQTQTLVVFYLDVTGQLPQQSAQQGYTAQA